MSDYDTLIIGGGPGGYVAAIKASQLGQKTAVIEKEHLGGICLNWGCIPTKALLRNAEVINLLQQGSIYGFSFDNLNIDYSAAQKRSRQVSERLVKGVTYLLRKNKVEVISGYGKLAGPGQVEVEGQRHTAKNIIIASGARARSLPGLTIDGDKLLTYHHALQLTELPTSIIIVGAGAIGMEFAQVFHSYGSEVTVVEMLPRVLPLEDEEISLEMEKQVSRVGIKIKTGSRVKEVETDEEGVAITVSRAGQTERLTAKKALIAIGVAPNSDNLGLETAGVRTERGFIQIDDRMQTNVPGIYAIGDVTGKLALAHVASAQALVAAEAIAGGEPHPLKYHNMPRCTYTHPEVASVGLSESQAREQGHPVKVGKFPFQANGKALGLAESDGFVKIVSDTKYNELLGVHMIGPHVTELLAGPTGMIGLETTLEELAHTVHPHPTLSEAVMEAAHLTLGQAIHI
jgi:dihydrolipoamide dehydrogenase